MYINKSSIKFQTGKVRQNIIQKNRGIVSRSRRLTAFPERVILITDKNYANICGKMQNCLTNDGIDVRSINARQMTMNDPYVIECFDGDHSKMLVIYYEPGNMKGETRFFTPNINAPPEIPWGLLRGSSQYRVDNLKMQSGQSNIVKKNGHIYKRFTKAGSPPTRRHNIGKLRTMNKFFDSSTPLVLVGTECLLTKNPRSMFLGQPQDFSMEYIKDKSLLKVGHITTSSPHRDIKKGTNNIAKAFKQMDFIDTAIIGNPKIAHSDCMAFLDNIGISVSTMTDFDSGTGYTTLEALSRSCLCMSKNSENAYMINSPIIDVRNEQDIIDRVKMFMDDPAGYEKTRRKQYEWGRDNFSYKAIANRFERIIQYLIKNGWRARENNPFRELG